MCESNYDGTFDTEVVCTYTEGRDLVGTLGKDETKNIMWHLLSLSFSGGLL